MTGVPTGPCLPQPLGSVPARRTVGAGEARPLTSDVHRSADDDGDDGHPARCGDPRGTGDSCGEGIVASVILPVHDAAPTLDAQLRALHGQRTDAAFEVLVVNDSSSDASAEIAAGWAAVDPRIRVVVAAGGGSYQARNLGVAAARGHHLLFCDADDVVGPEWVDGLLDGLRHHSLVGGPVDLHLLNDPAVQAWRAGGEWTADLPRFIGFLPFSPTANLGISRKVFTELGGFRPTARGGEDVGLCWRAQLAGHSLGFSSRAVVHYRARPSLRGHLAQHVRYGRSLLEQGRAFAAYGTDVPSLSRNLIAMTAGGLRLAAARLAGDRVEAGRNVGQVGLHAGMLASRLGRPPDWVVDNPGAYWPRRRRELAGCVVGLALETSQTVRARWRSAHS
jgi:glycosyltransferase involved in cell wall biosynthesis